MELNTWYPIDHPEPPYVRALIVVYVGVGQYLYADGLGLEKVKKEFPNASHWRMVFDAPEGAYVGECSDSVCSEDSPVDKA